MNKIYKPKNIIDLTTGLLKEGTYITSVKRMKDLQGVFQDNQAFMECDQDQIVYSVQACMDEENSAEGGLYWGTTKIEPGKIGNEFYMTRGHFHSKLQTAEYYWGISGKGMLICMDMNRNCWAEEISPGSLHYIRKGIAHRVSNTGSTPLVFNACWPSDAGHNYEEIEQNGFSARLLEENGVPALTTNR